MTKQVLIAVSMAFFVLATSLGPATAADEFYPVIVTTTPGGLTITSVQTTRLTRGDCDQLLDAYAKSNLQNCPGCTLQSKQCLPSLEKRLAPMLANKAIDMPYVATVNERVAYAHKTKISNAIYQCDVTASAIRNLIGRSAQCVAPVQR
ncbi:MAG: hypothetical protein JWL84_3368 [Rhodospirillales bacterium]|jgi:hypothetical protein|nr:hypothetical protein [Rhodospirillales bacterium]